MDTIPDLHTIYRIWLDPDINIATACREYRSNPGVEYAEPNYYAYITNTIPDDPDFSFQWALDNTGQPGGVEDADIDAPEAWDIQTGDPQVIIAVIDTGVDWNHPDLAANIWTNEGEIAGDSSQLSPKI